ncbi:MAG: efflux transporter periplasmic adaptor subunit, partial [Algoriphagus sp.]
NDGGVAKLKEIKTGISDFQNIEVLEGLEEGEQIISGPYFIVSKDLKEGDKVTAAEGKITAVKKD